MLARVFVLFLVFAVAQTAPAEPPDQPGKEPTTRKDEPAAKKSKKKKKEKKQDDDRALKAMKMVIEDAEFKAMPFEDFTEWLRRTTKINVVVRWALVEKAGVSRDQPITLKEEGITVAKLLEMVFREVTDQGKTTELSAQAEGNVLLISTRADINSRMLVRLYDVQELLIVVPDFPAEGLGEDQGGGGGQVTTGVRKNRPAKKKEQEEEKEEDQIKKVIDMITQTIDPPSWKVNGGKGTIVFFKGKLVIRNNAEVHQRLAIMLGHPGQKKSP